MATSRSVHRPVLTEELLREWCAAERWVALMTEGLPFGCTEAVHARAADAKARYEARFGHVFTRLRLDDRLAGSA